MSDASKSTTPADVVCVASWNADLISRIARPLARGETQLGGAFTIGPGGKGSNASVACARQGTRVAVIARIGGDDFGRMALALWAREGIETGHVEVVPGESSGVAQILVYDDGDNSIAVSPGAGAGLGEAQVVAAAETVRRARVVMASCEVPLEATLAAFRLAKAAGAFTLLNPAPAQPLPDELLVLTDLLTPNETELHLLAGFGPDVPEGTDTAASVARLMARGVKAMAVTLGSRGCELHQVGQPVHHLPCLKVTVADTIGAGDTFTGAMAAALARGLTLPDALVRANAAAALSVTQPGAIAGMPDQAAVAQLLSH